MIRQPIFSTIQIGPTPVTSRVPPPKYGWESRLAAVFFTLSLMGALLVPVIAWTMPDIARVIDAAPLATRTLQIALPAWTILMGLAVLAFRQSRQAFRQLLAVGFLSGLAVFGLTQSALQYSNARLDVSPAMQRTALVTGKSVRFVSGIPMLTLQLVPQEATRAASILTLPVSIEEFQRAIPGQSIASLTTRFGSLGASWISDHRLG